MFKDRLSVRSLAVLLILALVVSAFGFVAAQDNSSDNAPYIGVTLNAADKGVNVEDVQTGSPADDAGIKAGDVITAIDSNDVSADTIRDVIAGHKVGDVVTLTLTRGTDTLEVKVTLAASPAAESTQESAAPTAVAPTTGSGRPVLGVQLEDTDNGPVVRQVVTDSPADKAGLKVNDVLTKIGDTDVKDAQSAGTAVQSHKVGDSVSIEVTRDGKTVTVNVSLAAASSLNQPANPPTTPSQPAQPAAPATDRPVLGVQLQDTDNGATIEEVASGSPAEKAGLKVGDVLAKIGDATITTSQDASDAVQSHKAGDSVAIEVTRDGKTVTVNVTLAAASSLPQPANPPTAPSQPAQPAAPATDRPMLGVQLQDTDTGATIEEVVSGSPAEKAGLKVGDVLTKIGDATIKTSQDASDAVQSHKAGDEVSIDVTRDGKTVTVNATLSSAPASAFGFSQNGIGISYDGANQQWLISSLPQDSDLYKAGLREGDKVTQFDGTAYDPSGLATFLGKASGDVTLTVNRDGKDQEIKVPATTLMTLAMGGMGFGSGDIPFFSMPFNMGGGGTRLGVEFVTLDPSVAKEHNVTETVGALVTQVTPDSPAEKAGLKVNDVVTKVDGSEVNAEHTLRDLLANHKPGDKVTLDVTRDGKTNQMDVTLDQAPAASGFPFQFPMPGQNGNGFPFQIPGQGGQGGNGFPFQMPTPQPSSPLDNGSTM